MLIENGPQSVLFVITRGDSIGGGQIHVRDFAVYLKKRGINVWVATGTSGALTEQLSLSGIESIIIPSLKRSINPLIDIFAIRELVAKIKILQPELVSCHTAKAGLVGRLAAFLSGVPFIFTAHGWQFAEGIASFQKLIVLFIEAFLSRLTKRIITVSKYDQDLAFKYHLGNKEKIRLVHNGLPWMDAKPRKPLANNEVCRLIMVARFQEQKDHKTLFQVLGDLKSYNWELDLIGDGPLFEDYKNLAVALGLQKKIHFWGQRLDVPEFMDRANIFLLITHWEGFPRSIVEAMRAQLPVIASDVGGCKESVIHGITGYLVKRQDKQDLKKSLESLLRDPIHSYELGQAGRKNFECEFTFEHMFNQTAQIWSEVLRK